MFDYEELAKKFPEKYYFCHIKTKDNQAFYPDFIDNLKETLTDIEFDVEVKETDWAKHKDVLPSIYIPIAQRSWSIIKQINLWNYRSISMPTLRAALCQPEGWELREADAFVKTPKNNMTMAETLLLRWWSCTRSILKGSVYNRG
jgi:hypothetical protein